MPVVSVVMPVFNGEKYVAEAVESILTQTFTDFEFIIVDDGSRDQSAEIIRDYERQDDRICFLQLEENGGHAAARNRGIAAARGDYIATMDCDDISLPKRLEKQAAFMDRCPRIGLLGAQARYVDKDKKLLTVTDLPRRHALISIRLFFSAYLVHSATMIRRSLLDVVGGYDENYYNAPDLELYTRLLSVAKARFANLPEILSVYRVHEQSIRHNLDSAGRLRQVMPLRRMLEQLGIKTPAATLKRFSDTRPYNVRSWTERRLAKRDYRRIAAAFIANDWVDAEDEQLLIDYIDRKCGHLSPRLWQMFCHWRRHRFGPRKRT